MRAHIHMAAIAALFAAPLAATQDTDRFALGDDRFLAGEIVSFDEEGVDDLFMAGSIVRAESAIAGSAHLAGRRVELLGDAGGDVYLAGMSLVVSGAVAGDATLAGYDVQVGEVGGDLRVSAGSLVVRGAVGGSALLSGEDVRIDGPIRGDVHVRSRALSFSDDARVDGRLIVYEEELGRLPIPTGVASEDRVERRELAQWEDADGEASRTWGQTALRFLRRVAGLALLAALLAIAAPRTTAELRRAILDRPRPSLLYGFLAQAAIVGSGIVLAVILFGAAAPWIGIALLPATLLLALLAGVLGYVVAVHALGAGLLRALGRSNPDGLAPRLLAALLGALAARTIALIPILGWLALVALALAGLGAIGTIRRRTPCC